MAEPCVLDAGGYRVTFTFQPTGATKKYVDALIELTLDPQLGNVSVKSVPTFLALSDLRRLATYLKDHLSGIKIDPERASYIFLPIELGFQVQGLSGEVDTDEEGEVILRFMVNVGENPDDGSRVYVGAESIVAVERIEEFVSSLSAIAAEMFSSR
jgi:hypothetical protein